MKKIYVLDDNGVLQEIDAGVTEYAELTDAPILTTLNGVQLVGSTVSLVDGELTLAAAPGHAWTDEDTEENKSELTIFCENAPTGRYDIFTARFGTEILMIDKSNAQLGARYRRITVDQDQIYDTEVKQWATITDTSYKELIFNFLNEKELPNSVVVGDPYIPRFYYYSTVGSARITVTMNGTTFTAGTVSSGDTVSIDLTSRIVDGENTISIKFANSATEKFVNELRPIGININYSPAFDQYKPYDDSIIFNYSCTGSSAKVIHFDVTNANGEKTSHEISHNSGYFTGYATLQAEWFSKGENYIDTYMYAVDDNGNEIARTITTSYKVPFLTDNDPILMVYFDGWDELKQYASISVPYYVWRREAGNLDSIEFAITSDAINSGMVVYSYNTEDAGALVNYLQYNVGHNWLISSLPTSFVGKDDKKAVFTIEGTYGENKTNKYVKENVSIASSDSAMQTVEGYKFNFAATDLVKAVDEWESTGTDKKVLQLEGFNWNTDGIKIDEEGNQSLHFASAASASLSEAKNPVFGNYDTPFTLEISFKVSSSAAEVPIIKYTDPNEISNDPKGLYIYPNKAVFNYDGGKSEINFKSGERTHLTYTLCKKNVTDEDPTDGYKTKSAELLYLFVYINGILSQMKKLETNVKFPSNCGNIEFNTNHNEFDLYVFRGYAFSLSSAQILQNYISSFGDAAKKESLYLRNNLYNESLETGVQGEFEIDFSKVKGKIPCYVVVTDSLPESKDYNKCYGIYYEMEGESQLTEWKNNHSMATTYYYTREEIKNEDGEVIGYGDWFRNKSIKVGGQGTSSLAYPRKNLKFKHNDKFYIKGHKDGKDKTFTFKADYMDSSGANNIGNAQVLDDAIIREKWITTPVATDPDLRVNLDGFPVAVFWCQSSGLKGGVVQDENAEGVYDYFDEEKGLQPLYDAITVNPENPLIGEVTPLNPKYIGTFNFNYDKKAKALLGWNEDNFQGFEFRGNSSSCDLFRGFESFAAFASTAEGFEWRWTHISDWIDDYHDGHLSLTMDGGYFDEDVKQNYSEKAYLANREDIVYLKPFNRYYIEKDGKQLQLFLENEDGTYSPINYGSFDARNLGWNITDCEGISNPATGICLEYGVKIGEKDGVISFLYQLPYGLNTENPWGKAYEDGSHYYKFSWNPQHEFKFEYNEDQEYWTDEQYWTAFAPLTKIKAREDVYTPSDEGTHVLDEDDGLYHEIANYPEGQAPDTQKYTHSVVYHEVQATDKIITWDFMKDIFKNWCYVNEAVAHCDDQNYRAVLDSREEYGENGNGLFVWDSLTNYMAASIITGLCDNFAKNMFMHSYDGGLTWSPAWYDMD